MTRKSPYKHKVREHVRKQRPVRRYIRGKGPKPKPPPRRFAKRQVPLSTTGRGGFMVDFEYYTGEKENVPVDAKTHISALDRGTMARDRYEPPHIITITRK